MCVFGTNLVQAAVLRSTLVSCRVPASSTKKENYVHVEVSMNGVDFSNDETL